MSAESPFAPGTNRRRHRRVLYRDPVQVTVVGSPDQHRRYLLAEDLSESGLALSSPDPFSISSRLLMELQVSDIACPIRLTGRVVWAAQIGYQERYRLGVEFEDISAEALDQLRELVRARGR